MPPNGSSRKQEICECRVIDKRVEGGLVKRLKSTFMSAEEKLRNDDAKNTLIRGPLAEFVTRLFNNFYEQCALYNIRHCPFPGTIGPSNCFKNSLRDILTMLCFIVSNFSIFFIILVRMSANSLICFVVAAHWIYRAFINPPPAKTLSEKAGPADNVPWRVEKSAK